MHIENEGTREMAEKRIYTATDRTGVVYRHWRTTEVEARRYFAQFTNAPLLVGPQGEILVER